MLHLPSRRYVVGALFGASIVVIGSYAAAEALRYAATPTRIAVRATPIEAFDNRDPTKTRFGALEFRGGLALTSNFKPFGGISALHIEPDGRHFTAVTDKGSWLRGRIVMRDGKPGGIADAEMAPILVADRKPAAARGWYDAESMTESGGQLYVGIERAERILGFDLRRDGLTARGRPDAVPPDFKDFPYNKGLECLAGPRKGPPLPGTLIAAAEHKLDRAGNLRAFVLAGRSGGQKVTRFSIKRIGDFDIS
ncbi:MAG: esterase-like activity of phytase family protein, partial [Pseudolabrys sp.]|nr:esterase-like activity of phytase family protein [Pseudolabrys sp.]